MVVVNRDHLEPELRGAFAKRLDEEEVRNPDPTTSGGRNQRAGIGSVRDQLVTFNDHPLADEFT